MFDKIREDTQSIFNLILDKIKDLLNGEPMSNADLMVVLEERAEGTGLNWKESVVDFLTLLGIDSSMENRTALAKELKVANEFRIGSASGNEALRVAVFKKLAENGGKVPASLLD